MSDTHTALTLYDADAQTTAVQCIARMPLIAAFIDEQCDAHRVGPMHRASAHRQHGVLIARGVTGDDALKAALAQYIARGVKPAALFTDNGGAW
jgi:hypothetical protein